MDPRRAEEDREEALAEESHRHDGEHAQQEGEDDDPAADDDLEQRVYAHGASPNGKGCSMNIPDMSHLKSEIAKAGTAIKGAIEEMSK